MYIIIIIFSVVLLPKITLHSFDSTNTNLVNEEVVPLIKVHHKVDKDGVINSLSKTNELTKI